MEKIESILTSVKKFIGVAEEYEHFDPDIIMHINATFSDLYDLGVGPSEGFSISDKETLWTDFIPETLKTFNDVQRFIYLKVKLLFDPTSLSSAVLAAYEREIARLEWKLCARAESVDFEEV